MANLQVQIFTSQDGLATLEVALEQDTVWLSQAQMCDLFDRNKRTVSEHIRNIFKDNELEEAGVVRKFRTTAADGKLPVLVVSAHQSTFTSQTSCKFGE